MRITFLFFLILGIPIYISDEVIKLVLVRNGESIWNQLNLFAGWTDVQLSPKGEEDAIRAGKLLKQEGYIFDICYTSVLKRSIKTAIHLLDEIDQLYIPLVKHFRLNGRHYGALQGLNKEVTYLKYGEEKVKSWRKSYDNPPPSLHHEDKRNPANQLQYKDYPKEQLPLRESFKDILDRVIPYYQKVILPDIKSGKKVLITAHSNSLRALIKYLDNISEQEIVNFRIRNGVPLIYELDDNLKPVKRYYLDNKSQYEDIYSKIRRPDLELDSIVVDKLSEEQEKIVFEICKDADDDFVPPLSSRVDTVHKFKDTANIQIPKDKGLQIFFNEIKKESFIFIMNKGKIGGFMSFIKDYSLHLDDDVVICDYITIIIIDSRYRNKGFTKKMYEVILKERKGKKIATRTWSTNFAHMHILDKLGFKLVQRDIDDRGVNIDTVYYLKNTDETL